MYASTLVTQFSCNSFLSVWTLGRYVDAALIKSSDAHVTVTCANSY